MKKIVQILLIKCSMILASCALIFAQLSANVACSGPFFEPEQPKELQYLKKF